LLTYGFKTCHVTTFIIRTQCSAELQQLIVIDSSVVPSSCLIQTLTNIVVLTYEEKSYILHFREIFEI